MRSFIIFISMLLLPFLGGKVSAFIAGDIGNDYINLILPDNSPQPQVFPIVWMILYFLMGLASWLVYRQAKYQKKSLPHYLAPYGRQLAINLCWPPIFFGVKAYWVAFGVLIVLFLSVLYMIRRFYQINKIAAFSQIPYALWLTYALYLNYFIALWN